MEENTLLYSIVGLVLFLITFLILREVVLWYWKVNNIIDNQNETNKLLEEQNKRLAENTTVLQNFVNDFMDK